MSGFYRRPGIDTPSSEGSPDRNNNHRHARPRSENLPSTIGGGGGGQLVPSRPPSRPTSPPESMPQFTADGYNVRDLLMHSLLEDKFINQAASQLGKDRNHPDVQRLGRSTYEAFCESLPGVSEQDRRIAGESMLRSRLAVREGVGLFARHQMDRGLIPAPDQAGGMSLDQQDCDSGSATPRATSFKHSPSDSVDDMARPSLSIPIPENTALAQQHPLHGSPGVHVDQYRRDFTELSKVGKGGYGRVFKVRHKLDNSVYAVKRIVVSKHVIEKIHRQGPAAEGLGAMDSLLEEVRAMARLDHKNVVRYFHAWFDYAPASTSASMDISTSSSFTSSPTNRLEEGSARSDDEIDLENLHFGDFSFNDRNDDMAPDIRFEYSDSGPGPEYSEEESQDLLGPIISPSKAIRGRKRSATLETIFSVSSNSTERAAGEDDEEADETIPRSDLQVTRSSAPAHRREYVAESTVASQALSTLLPTTVLTLNVQMSLYDTNLAMYLNPDLHSDSDSTDLGSQLRHCYHPLISLQLLTEILEGVEYLHSQGIVHRDLKPANIFLSISNAKIPPMGSVDVKSCAHCPSTTAPEGSAVYVNPRIGDLGLVAALDDGVGATSDCPGAATGPVGTEFYRPFGKCLDLKKLDVFSLGVVLFELVRRFSTKMERFEALKTLKDGRLPPDFVPEFGGVGPRIEALVLGMVERVEDERFSCDEVKSRLVEIVAEMKC